MVIHLLQHGFLNDVSVIGWGIGAQPIQHGSNVLESTVKARLQGDLAALLAGDRVGLSISHKGRVRLSELQQALQTGRDREPFGILLGQRHVLPDLIIALASTTPTAPLSVAYLDANSFKNINDTVSHAAGDEALRTYLSVVATMVEGRGEAYRAGGDEVVVIMPGTSTDLALHILRAVVTQLHKEKMPGDLPLSLSCGIVITTDADTDAAELLKKADEVQQRAKERSRQDTPRPSVIAVEGSELETISVK